MKDLVFINSPGSWIHYPILPMIRRSDGKAGFLWVGTGPVVYMENIYKLTYGGIDHVTMGIPKAQFESFEKLVEEWRVD